MTEVNQGHVKTANRLAGQFSEQLERDTPPRMMRERPPTGIKTQQHTSCTRLVLSIQVHLNRRLKEKVFYVPPRLLPPPEFFHHLFPLALKAWLLSQLHLHLRLCLLLLLHRHRHPRREKDNNTMVIEHTSLENFPSQFPAWLSELPLWSTNRSQLR